VIQSFDNLSHLSVSAARRGLVQAAMAIAVATAAALGASVTHADARAREISSSSYAFADSPLTNNAIERPAPSQFGDAGAHQCWIQCGPAFGTTIVRRSDLQTSNTADLSARKTADGNGHSMGVGGTIVVERLESDASGSLTNWIVVSERTLDEDGSHSWTLLSRVPSDAPWRPSDLYRFEGSSFSTELAAGETTGATPEPSTWMMVLMGFAGLFLASYRRTRTGQASILREGTFLQ
jgi:hypothetical protein